MYYLFPAQISNPGPSSQLKIPFHHCFESHLQAPGPIHAWVTSHPTATSRSCPSSAIPMAQGLAEALQTHSSHRPTKMPS